MMSKTIKLIIAVITIFIIMPLNGFLFTLYPAWFPIILILTQIPMIVGILKEWHDEPKVIYRDRVEIDNDMDNIGTHGRGIEL